jgi:molybdate transport system ATP-binding protein
VSHELADLLKLTNRLCIIQRGKCIGHDTYHRLLQQQPAADMLGSHTLLNAVQMNVESIDNRSGLALLRTPNRKNTVHIICERSATGYSAGQTITIFIDSRDIALSQSKLTGVTIQNQLEGRITDIFERNATTFCRIDAGIPLIVEITARARSQLDLNIGSAVWCLFKSVAIDVAG